MWVGGWVGALPNLFFCLLNFFGKCSACNVKMLAGPWLRLCTCLCREETPGLITPTSDTLLLPGSFFSLPFPSFFPCFFAVLVLLPLLLPPLRLMEVKAVFSPSLVFFHFLKYILLILLLIFFMTVFSPLLCCSLLVCNWLFFCLSSLSFTRFILHSFSNCPFSRSLPFLGSLPSTPFSFFPCVHVFKAVFLGVCVSLSLWQVLNIHIQSCV